MNNMDSNNIAAQNMKIYLEKVGRTQEWASKKAGIPEKDFQQFLNGQGEASNIIAKLNKLLRIDDPFYFYNPNFLPPKSVYELQLQSTLYKELIFNYPEKADEPHLKDTLEMLEDFITMIDVLETIQSNNIKY